MTVIDTPNAISMIRLFVCIQGCEMYAKTGMKLARNLPTVAQLRQQYGITARTYKQAAVELTALRESLQLVTHA